MNRSLFFIAGALLFWGFGEGMFFNFVPIYLDRQFFLSEHQIGLILGVFGFSMAVTHIPAGRLSDRFGRRPLLIAAWVLGLFATLVMAVSLNLPLFLLGLFAYGMTAFVTSPLNSYVTAARGNLPVGTVLALTTATFGMGMVLGPLTGGWIDEHFGMRMSFYSAGLVFIISNGFMLFIKRQPIDLHNPDSPPPGLGRNQRFVALMMILALAVFSMYIAQPLTPNFLEGVRSLSLQETGLVFTLGALGNSLMAIALSRVDPRRGFLIAQALVILFAVCIWKGTSLPVFALGYFLLGGFRAGRPMIMAQARELVHESQMGVSYGIMETISAAIFIITPPIAGYLFEINPILVYPISILLIAVSISVSSVFSYRKAVEYA